MEALSWMTLIVSPLYLIPLGRPMTKPLRSLRRGTEAARSFPYPKWLLRLGRVEYLLGPVRDRVLSYFLFIWVVYRWIRPGALPEDVLIASSFVVFYNLLSVLAIRHRDGVRLRLAELARVRSNIHAEDFFNLYYVQLSPYPPPFPRDGFRTVDYSEANYNTGAPPKQGYLPLAESAVSTNTLAHIAMLAFNKVGPDFGRDAFDGLARLWGSRIANNFKAHLKTTFMEPIPPLEGKTLLVFNHKSYLDFALNFFALGDIHQAPPRGSNEAGRHLRPRFIAAKDHFIDNPFIYSFVGLGKVIENAGMIFVERRKKGKGWMAMTEAAEKISESDVEVAIYPQGTRAHSFSDSAGDRLDAGYYTTFTRRSWDQPLGHLKPGTAHLIQDTLIKLKGQGEEKLNVLIVGIFGSGIAGPKGSFKIQTQTEIEYRVGPLWTLTTQLVEGMEKPESSDASQKGADLYKKGIQTIQQGINERFLKILDWHRSLKERTEKEMTFLKLPDEKVRKMHQMLKKADECKDARPYILLDRILSLNPKLWERFFLLLISLQVDLDNDAAWRALLQEVSERLMRK